jgi:hypothetical protein
MTHNLLTREPGTFYGMLQELKKLFSKVETQRSDGLNQEQREAIIELLVLCMYADNQAAVNEDRILQKEVERFTWESEQSVEDFIGAFEGEALAIKDSPESRQGYLQDIGRRLKTEDLRFRALKLCKLLFYSDWQMLDEEKAFVKEIRKAFRLGY